jgi:hypothetical protein
MMNRKTILILSIMLLIGGCAPNPTSNTMPTSLAVKSVGPQRFSLENTVYSYGELVSKIRNTYGDAHIHFIDVDMGDAPVIGDLLLACSLQNETGIPVHAHYLNKGEVRNVSCQ